jgi:hypothetical protein
MNNNITEKFNKYISKYGENYDKSILEFILNNFYKQQNIISRTDVIDQIYSHLKINNNIHDNIYSIYYNMIKNQFNLDINIIEPCCGMFPALAEKIDQYQRKIKQGTITVYDPNLVVNKLGNIKLMAKEINKYTNTKNYDLLISIMPCEATETVIKNVILNKLDFFIVLCDCDHHLEYKGLTKEQKYNVIYRYIINNIDSSKELYVKENNYNNPIFLCKTKRK